MGVSRWAKGIQRLHHCIAGQVQSLGPRRQVWDYLKPLVRRTPRHNGRQPEERAGDAISFGLLLESTQSLGSPGSVGTVSIQLPR